jgi:NhaP-type Na+/H+ or K+/H+ antiporter
MQWAGNISIGSVLGWLGVLTLVRAPVRDWTEYLRRALYSLGSLLALTALSFSLGGIGPASQAVGGAVAGACAWMAIRAYLSRARAPAGG